jgi:hypothetical protein
MSQHAVFTIISPIELARVDELETLLARVRAERTGNGVLDLPVLPAVTHFSCLAITEPLRPGIESEEAGEEAGEEADEEAGEGALEERFLLFEHNVDVLDEAHDPDQGMRAAIDEMVTVAGEDLAAIYDYCEGYEAVRDDDPARAGLKDYLERHACPPAARYIGVPGLSLEQIKADEELHRRLRERAEAALEDPDPPRDAREAHARLARELALEAQTSPRTRRRIWRPPARLVLGLVVTIGAVAAVQWRFGWRPVWLLLLGVLVVLLALLLVAIGRTMQLLAREWGGPVRRDHVRTIRGGEDEPGRAQNHMTSVAPMKQLWLDRLASRVIFAAVHFVVGADPRWAPLKRGLTSVGRGLVRAGRMLRGRGAPPAAPKERFAHIHFAHWIAFDQGRRLLFMTNYNGSWESYLDDFIANGAGAVSAVWGQSVGFPRTDTFGQEGRFFQRLRNFIAVGEGRPPPVRVGAKDGVLFKAIVRDRQSLHQAWYSAYPDLTLDRIEANQRLRQGLRAQDLSEDRALTWLADL